MKIQFFSGLIYLLGFVGLASIGLLPLRSFQIAMSMLRGDAQEIIKKMVITIFFIIFIGAIVVDAQITFRIFKCLTEKYCGPSISSGWSYLAILGGVYIIFESISFVLQKASNPRKWQGKR